MNDIITKKIDNYFKNRTPNGGGIVKDILSRPNMDANSINVGDNDYLNVATLVDVEQSDQEVVFSSVFSIDGAQNRVEKKLAQYLGREACLITQSGYASNTGTMQAICDRNTVLYVDRYLHSSFRDGIALKKAKVRAFKHNNMVELEELIKKFGPGVIMVEGLYSVDGDCPPINKLVELKKKYGCTLLVDESHSLGIYGHEGMGFSSTADEYHEVDIFTASLAKTFGSRAGIVAGSQRLIDFIRENSFHNVFSSSVMNYDIIRIEKILAKIKTMDPQRAYLMEISKYFRDNIPSRYLKYAIDDVSPIVSLWFDNEQDLIKMNKWMLKRNIFASCFCAPATITPCLRFTMNANLSLDKVNFVLNSIHKYTKIIEETNTRNSINSSTQPQPQFLSSKL